MFFEEVVDRLADVTLIAVYFGVSEVDGSSIEDDHSVYIVGSCQTRN